MPWHLPADLAHFKRLTLDKPIIMGRRTWESLPGPLPRRLHIVVSMDPFYCAAGCVVVSSLAAAVAAAGRVPEIMVAGGAAVYQAMLPMAKRMYITVVHAEVEGDALFPPWDPRNWKETGREEYPRDDHNRYDLTFLTLERIGNDLAA